MILGIQSQCIMHDIGKYGTGKYGMEAYCI